MYLLPCPQCDEKVLVEPPQAGQRITCVCGQSLDVPTLGQIRQLEPAPSQQPQKDATGSWTSGQRVAFLVGMILMVVALIAVPLLLLGARELQPDFTVQNDISIGNEMLERISLEQSLEMWQIIREEGLGEQMTPQYLLDARRAQNLRISAGVLAVAGVAGLFLMVVPLSRQLIRR